MYESEHIKKSRKGYWGHTWFAIYAGVTLIAAGILSIIHSIVPNFFPYQSERMIKKLLEQSELLRH